MNLITAASRAVRCLPWRRVEPLLQRLENAWFDRHWQVDTAPQEKTTHCRAAHGQAFRRLLQHFGIAPQGTFVNLGSGKGRMLLSATQAGFAHAVGVESMPELAAIARENARQFIKRFGAGDITTLCMDAKNYDFKVEDRMLFVGRPNGPTMTQAVAQQLCRTLERSPRIFDVLCAQPDWVEVLTIHAPLKERARLTQGGVEFTWLRHEPARTA